MLLVVNYIKTDKASQNMLMHEEYLRATEKKISVCSSLKAGFRQVIVTCCNQESINLAQKQLERWH